METVSRHQNAVTVVLQFSNLKMRDRPITLLEEQL